MATNPLKILTFLTASKAAKFLETVEVSGALTADNGLTVLALPLNASAVAVSASSLNVTNNAALSGGATVTGAPLDASAVAVSASSLNVTNNVVIGGNLTVRGTTTSIDSTTVNIGDLNLNLGTGSTTAAGVDGGGLDLGSGSIITLRYDNANTAWTSNIDVNLATDTQTYKISGSTVLAKSGTKLTVGNGGIANVAVTTELDASGSLFLSGSSNFVYITGSTRNAQGLYNVDTAIHYLDTAISGVATAAGGGTAAIISNYNATRTVVTGNLVAGTSTVILSTVGGTQFAVGQIDNIALDIMVDTDSTGYTNDLVAIKMFVSASDLNVQIDAPASATAKYRLIAVNEKDGGLG